MINNSFKFIFSAKKCKIATHVWKFVIECHLLLFVTIYGNHETKRCIMIVKNNTDSHDHETDVITVLSETHEKGRFRQSTPLKFEGGAKAPFAHCTLDCSPSVPYRSTADIA